MTSEISDLAANAKPVNPNPAQTPLIIKRVTHGQGIAQTPAFDLRSLGATPPTRGLRPGAITRVGQDSARGGSFQGRGGSSSGSTALSGIRVGIRGGRGGGRGARGAQGARGTREGRERRTRGGEGGGGDGDESTGDSWEGVEHNEGQAAYMKEKARKEAGSSQSVDPVEITEESLVGYGPSVVATQRGMSEVVEDCLDRMATQELVEVGVRHQELAKKLIRGELLRFKNEEEEKAVVALAQRMSNEGAALRSEEKGEIVNPIVADFEPLDEASRSRLAAYLISGEYKPKDHAPSDPILQDVVRRTKINATYGFADTDKVVAKVTRLLPKQRPAAAPKRVAA